jgi:dTDP-4-dehydrorhamnose reductase
MRVLITGAGGQVGRELVQLCTLAGDDVVACSHADLDVGDREAVLQVVEASRPDVIVHAAAWTAVDDCESDPERALRANAIGTRHVAEAAHRTRAHVVHVSTDYVFDGRLDRPYTEWDRPNPQSVYGWSKYAGELELAGNPDTTIVRTSWVCGRYGRNMVKTVLRLASEHESLAFVDDQRGHLTIVADLVPLLRRFGLERRPGVFHATNQGADTWYGVAREVLAAAGQDAARVRPVTSADLDPPRPAPRPANSVLDNAAMRLSGLPLLPDYRESLPRLVRQVLSAEQ